jgi:cell division protein FtsW
MTARNPDRIFLVLTVVLVFIGLLIFSSASLGLLARSGASFSSVAFSQLVFGVVGGLIALFVTSSVHYRLWRQYAFYFLCISVIFTLAVFIPGLGFEHGGATRWIDLRVFTFQPAEILKIAFIIYMATWISGMRRHIHKLKKGLLPFVAFVAGVGVPLLLQPDTDTYILIATASMAMFLAAGGKFYHVLLMALVGLLLIALLAISRPYIMDRMQTFIDPSLDPLGTGYQIKQSLIAVGSGGMLGRGFGQSIQKFEYLPEPIGDSIFAVYAEEFGFVGSVILVLLFAVFIMRGYRIATHAPDLFAMLLVVGILTLLAAQIFLNIAAMLGITPLSGLPLPFVSHGGTALFVTLASVGIVLNVSKYQKPKAL